MAAPSSINDCEKIQAADAYNQCLALFGPTPRGHGGSSARDFGGDGDARGANVVETASPDMGAPEKGRHARGRRHYSHSTRHERRHGRHGSYGHYRHGHGHSSAYVTHGHGKRLAFNVISGKAKAR